MEIKQIILHHIQMPLVSPFTTSYGETTDRDFIIVEMIDENGIVGWGECAAFASPWYTEETVKTAWHMMEDFLIPLLFKTNIDHPNELTTLFSPIRRNNMAKAALEEAVWDLYAKRRNITLASALGGNKAQIEVGAAIGIQSSTDALIDKIEDYLSEGYKRIKIKIKPSYDVEQVEVIRKHFPDLPLMADANSAYTLNDIDALKELDHYHLMMIEQPLSVDDIVDHAKLQKAIKTPICLDESITSFDDARKAIELNSCKVINLKIGRLGGISETIKIHDYCRDHDIAVWCGGMLESGIGRAHNIALTTLEHFTLPGDTSGSARYWHKDIIEPEVVVKNGLIDVPTAPGIGFEVKRNELTRVTLYQKTFTN
ncbi:o-succinylbenzoate synthase [Bacillus taeanensis]|uniref:o-succinylbenzoate synthase n=1 Tax=Bacillus taeanensis TaxID=273032 RepID=A0A366Y0F6_9BACI|nr:o-succinylbenzoate synthase [Bacillus taeanensis]RBW71328.1 o-succinylbenzoate synthase [Bacillus taeanensis]